VQIDTISVTERSHHHVLFSRNPRYQQDDIFNLMDQRAIFEYWSHAAALLPMDDYRFSLFKKNEYRNGGRHWFDRNPRVERYVMDRIRAEGPLQSKDFETPKNHNAAWYEWKPAKIALTNLFMDGSLMIANRKNFLKIFDLTERVLPPDLDTRTPSESEYLQYLIQRTIRAHGLVIPEEIAYLRKGIKPQLKKVLNELLEAGTLIPLMVEGNSWTYFTTKTILERLDTLPRSSRQVHILNPFDNLLIQRKRVKALFGFDYIIECYVPAPKRVFGYYTLAVLYGDRLVMRFDAKAHRKTGVLIVNGMWYEKGFKPSHHFKRALDKKLMAFAKFCGCDKVEIPN
jgi:uncharacterized protein YcaQ